MEGRTWIRASGKDRRGESGSRLLPTKDPEGDTMLSTQQKMQIASIVQGARASLQEPSRPFTPGDMPRHLFSGDDYQNRPGSSYKMKNVVGQAIEEFANANTQPGTAISTGSRAKPGQPKGGIQNQDKNIIDVLKQAELKTKSRPQQLPAIDLQQAKSLKPKTSVKPISGGGPVKAQIQQKPSQGQIGMEIQGSKLQAKGDTSSKKSISQIPPSKPKEKKPVIHQEVKKEELKREDYSDLISTGQKVQEEKRFKENQIENQIKLQEIQKQIKSANRMREEEKGELEDEYEDYFANQMMNDLQGVQGYEQQIDYGAALQKVQEKIKHVDQTQRPIKTEEDENFEDLMQDHQQEFEQNPYKEEYNEVIEEISRLCQILSYNSKQENKERRQKLNENEIFELVPRILSLVKEYEKQSQFIKDQCFMETLLKGTFSLLGANLPKAALRLTSCIVQIFFQIFDGILKLPEHQQESVDLKKTFQYLYETMRGILIYAKEGQFDLVFKDENLLPALSQVLTICFLEKSDFILKHLKQVINKTVITNDDLIYDLVNYTMGSIKCFTQSNQEVQKEAVTQNYIPLISNCISKALDFGKNQNKKSMMLVQLTGALRNLVGDQESYLQICKVQAIPKLISILKAFKGHKELMLNVSRILSKLSLDTKCSVELLKTKQIGFLLDIMGEFTEFTPFVIRIAFVLGNITTFFDHAREQLGGEGIQKTLKVLQAYLSKDENSEQEQQKKKGPDILGNIEDCMTKLIRLIANMATEEQSSNECLYQNREEVEQVLFRCLEAVKRRNLQQNDEFILNVISLLTNILFYDIPQRQIISDPLRVDIFRTVKGFILSTDFEETQIETVRVLSNLSRHQTLCVEYVADKNFLETLIIVLDHTLRDLVFYAVGIIINITLHPTARNEVVKKEVIPKLIDVLKDSNIEDLDLSRVSGKALHNMTQETDFWNKEIINKLDEILTNLGEELDSIMEMGSEEEQQELRSLRDIVNALINDMPEPVFACSIDKCGRKFKNKEELDSHIERRHKK